MSRPRRSRSAPACKEGIWASQVGAHAEEAKEPLVASEPLDGFEHRKVGFTGAILLDALPGRNREAGIALEPAQQGVYQGGLSDTRLTGDEDDLPLGVERPRELPVERGELEIPADQHRGLSRSVQAGGQAGNEPVPATRQRDDEPGSGGIVAERLPDLLHTDLEHLRTHMHIGPQGAQDLFLGRHPAALFDQVPQYRGGLGPQVHPAAIAPQRLRGKVQTEGWKEKAVGCGRQGARARSERKVVVGDFGSGRGFA